MMCVSGTLLCELCLKVPCLVFDRVSSVLNRDVKQFGKKFMFDCSEESCWNSDQVTKNC